MNLEEEQDLARDILDLDQGCGTPLLKIERDGDMVKWIGSRVMTLDFGHGIAESLSEEVIALLQVRGACLAEPDAVEIVG